MALARGIELGFHVGGRQVDVASGCVDVGVVEQRLVWPERLPRLTAYKLWRLDFTEGAVVALEKLPEDEQEELKVGPEFYSNELLLIDPMDVEAVARFLATYGFLFGRYPDLDHRSLTTPITERGSLLGTWPGWHLSFSSEGREPAKARQSLLWKRMAEGLTYPFELIAQTRLGLSWLRDVTRLALLHNEVRLNYLPEEWESERFGIPRPSSSEEAFAILVTSLNGGLQSIHPIVTAPDLVDNARSLSLAMGAPPIYSIIIAGIYNHIAEGASYKKCENETCPRPYKRFVRQTKNRTGAISEAPRSTAKFSSITCKNAQKQRERRRKKAKGAC